MKIVKLLLLSILFSMILSCSNSKVKYNIELSEGMKLEVNYINNQMPSTDNSSSRYISFMVIPESGSFDESWKTTALVASSGELEVQVMKFDKNDFEGKDEKVYRNNVRIGLSELASTIDVTIILVSESGERIKLSKSNIQEEVVQ
jgi:hypothetical protein